MKGGFSGCSGIILYDTEKEGNNAVFGYYEGEEITIKTGFLEELKGLKNEMDKVYERKDKTETKVVLVLAVVIVALIIASFACMSFFKGLMISTILIAAYMPILVLCFANMNEYKSDEVRMQFRRYHGCEHKALRLITKEKEVTIDNLKSMSIYNAECGTVYMGYVLFLLLIMALLVFLSVSFLKALGIVILTIVLIILNLFNPYNPFVILQKNAVAEPTEREYALGLELIKKLEEL